ncbi:MAG: hypothetical protein E7320_07920 [Clostridiales bacterium]|nr:hypothetical protein [Clostridiales bacterium]
MGQLIDLCGLPIQLGNIKSFQLVKRDFLFHPAYQETAEQTFSLFARRNAESKKKFVYTNMVPYGALLSDKEKPTNKAYEIKSFGEAAGLNILAGVEKAVNSIAGIAVDLLRIDTSGNKTYHVLTEGRRITDIKLRDIPAKVRFLSGKVSDVYKNDPYYEFLGEPIAPIVVSIPTLVVTVDKTTHVFFGGGVDLEDAEATYHTLLNAYNDYQAQQNEKKPQGILPKFNVSLPKIKMPSIKLQSPIAIQKETNTNQASLEESSSMTEHD